MFEHSIRVPRLYKTATDIYKKVRENNGSLKNLVYEKKFQNIKAIYALIVTTLKYSKQLEFLLKKTQLLEKEQRLDPSLARILISELLWGKQTLPGDSKPIKTVRSYEQILKAHISDISLDELKVKKVLKPRYVRVNTILTTVNEVVEGFRDEGWSFVRFMDTTDYDGFLSKVSNLGPEEFMVDIHIKELLIFPPNTQFYRHDAYKNGLIILQDKSSCLPVHFLDPEPGSTVLDMCAAPGMKTSQIAAKINNEGKVFAVDKDAGRLQTLNELMEKSSITCVTSINKDILQVTNADCPDVEYILVDPSCSGTGIVDRMDFTEGNANNDDFRVKKLAGFQIMILKHAVRKFPKAKRIVYSTCSLNPRENEAVVEEVISMCPVFKLVPAGKIFKSKWNNFGGKEYGEIGKRCVYTKPEDDLTNGFFVAVFERLEEGEQNEFLVQKGQGLESKAGLGENNAGLRENDAGLGENNAGLGENDAVMDETETSKSKKKKNCDFEDVNLEVPKELPFGTSEASKVQKKKKKKCAEAGDALGLESGKTEDVEGCMEDVPQKKKKNRKDVPIDNGLDETNLESTNHELVPKKKKRSKIENAEEESCSILESNDQRNQEHVSKKKKKLREKEVKTTNTNIEVSIPEDMQEHIPKKKKKTKLEHEEGESCSIITNGQLNQEDISNEQEDISNEQEHISKKKKKSSLEEKGKGESCSLVTNDQKNQEHVSKKKKKLREKEVKTTNTNIEVSIPEDMQEHIPKKKKKTKLEHEEGESCSIITNGQLNQEDISNEQEHISKKKKKSRLEEKSKGESCSLVTNDQKNQEHVSKKKKKLREKEINTANTNIEINNSEDIREHNSKKKKKMKLGNEEGESCSKLETNDQVNQQDMTKKQEYIYEGNQEHNSKKKKKFRLENKEAESCSIIEANNKLETNNQLEANDQVNQDHISKKKNKTSKLDNNRGTESSSMTTVTTSTTSSNDNADEGHIPKKKKSKHNLENKTDETKMEIDTNGGIEEHVSKEKKKSKKENDDDETFSDKIKNTLKKKKHQHKEEIKNIEEEVIGDDPEPVQSKKRKRKNEEELNVSNDGGTVEKKRKKTDC